jgi:hypothetical protein
MSMRPGDLRGKNFNTRVDVSISSAGVLQDVRNVRMVPGKYRASEWQIEIWQKISQLLESNIIPFN